MIDALGAGRMYRDLRVKTLDKEAHQAHIAHTVMPNEVFEPSLIQRLVFFNRADWYISAALSGWCDVDLKIEEGEKRFLTQPEINAIINKKSRA